MEQFNEWMPQEKVEISVTEMDKLIQQLSEKRKEYEASKRASADKYRELEELETLVTNTLKTAGRSKYEAEGVAAVDIRVRESFTTPKSVEDKTRLFNYIKNKYGADTLLTMTSINHATLNSWASKEIEADPGLQIPGMQAPTATEILYFRSKE